MGTGRRIQSFVVATALSLFVNPIYLVPAEAAIPAGMPQPGTYSLREYTLGQKRTGSLVVSDLGEYKHQFNTRSGILELWLAESSDSLFPFTIVLTDLNLGGLYFEPTYGHEAIYRPYVAPGLLAPMAGNTWTMYSGQAGGVYLDAVWRVVEPHFLLVNDVPVFVQRIDVTMTFYGAGSGSIYHTHFEVPGSPLDFRDEYHGDVTVLGQLNVVHTSVAHGLLATS